ncbi:MAG: FecR domain-containing protein [Hyphomicrobiales bacterium]|nr:FecR domain-containing protein [Hyphomicrobiales bacterium]
MRAWAKPLWSGVFLINAVAPGPAQDAGPLIRPPAGPGQAAPIGKIVNTNGVVAIERASDVMVTSSVGTDRGRGAVTPVNAASADVLSINVKTGDAVFTGDVVKTGADGAVGIVFNDGTAFNVSSNARMTLNEFVYDPKGNANSTLFSLSKGTFTFIAGKVAKTGSMKVDTPVATMGIRGTTPHVKISEDGSVEFSTLLEDYKDSAKKPRQRAVRVAPPSQTIEAPAPIRIERKPAPSLNICANC